MECGLCPEGEKNTAVRLKTPPTQEAAVFVSTITGCAAWDALSTLPESIALRWAMPGRPGARDLGGPGEAAKRVWVRRARAGNVRIQGGGHLVRILDLSSFKTWSSFCRSHKRPRESSQLTLGSTSCICLGREVRRPLSGWTRQRARALPISSDVLNMLSIECPYLQDKVDHAGTKGNYDR